MSSESELVSNISASAENVVHVKIDKTQLLDDVDIAPSRGEEAIPHVVTKRRPADGDDVLPPIRSSEPLSKISQSRNHQSGLFGKIFFFRNLFPRNFEFQTCWTPKRN